MTDPQNAPVFLNGMGRGCIPSNHSQLFVYSRRPALGQADVAVLIGTEIDFRVNYGAPPLFNPGVKVIQIDIDQTEIGRNRDIDLGIIGDAGEVLKQLVAELDGRKMPDRKDVPIMTAQSVAMSKGFMGSPSLLVDPEQA